MRWSLSRKVLWGNIGYPSIFYTWLAKQLCVLARYTCQLTTVPALISPHLYLLALPPYPVSLLNCYLTLTLTRLPCYQVQSVTYIFLLLNFILHMHSNEWTWLTQEAHPIQSNTARGYARPDHSWACCLDWLSMWILRDHYHWWVLILRWIHYSGNPETLCSLLCSSGSPSWGVCLALNHLCSPCFCLAFV